MYYKNPKIVILSFLTIMMFFSSCENDSVIKETKNLFLEVEPNKSNISFQNTVKEDKNLSIINYIYFYNGAGVASGDVNGDGLPDLFFVANSTSNKLYLNKGNMVFEDISKTANITGNASWNTGVTFVDINGDNLLDIYVCAVTGLFDFGGHNELFVNQGDGTFVEESKKYGLDYRGYSTQAYFFDFDKDDDLDVYIVNHAVHTNLSHGKAALRNKRIKNVGDVLLRNDDGTFNDISQEAGIYGGINGYGLSAAIFDANNDGWDDIYVCNDFHEDDYLYVNDKNGGFNEELSQKISYTSRFSMGCDVGDFNNDGYQDLITLDMLPNQETVLKETEGDDVMLNKQAYLRKLGYKEQYSRNMLQMNQGGEYFIEIGLLNNVADTDWSWAPLFADFNNDGQQDLFISNGIKRRPNGLDFTKYVSSAFKGRDESAGLEWLYKSIDEMPEGKVPNEIYQGSDSIFIKKSGIWIDDIPNSSNGAVYSDLDMDGDLDIVLNNFNSYASILENTTITSNNSKPFFSSVSIKLKYKKENINGIGSKVYVYSRGKEQMKQLFNSRGFLSSVNNKLHFGLGEEKIDSIKIEWPNLRSQTIIPQAVESALNIEYDENNSIVLQNIVSPSKNIKFTEEKIIEYAHEEDSYSDFKNEKLIPYKVSDLGPAIATGDIDNNGFDDLFVGGASGKESFILYNNGSSLLKENFQAFKEDIDFEDNAAAFFDADNDGDLDLMVVTGSSPSLRPMDYKSRLYINDNGNYSLSKNALPAINYISSTVSVSDYDRDGDFDLFIGNKSVPGNFGLKVPSFLLKNNGKGIFSVDNKFNLQGIVTDSEWSDIDGDGMEDLLVSTEWDDPKVFLNRKDGFKEVMFPMNIHGLWQTIKAHDIDKDGDLDILLGNWGLNTKFNINFDGPLKMFHDDFDENGIEENIIAYYRDENYYPINSKSELASQMNFIDKKFLDNKSYAGKTVEQIFTSNKLKSSIEYQVNVLNSGFLRNEGGNFESFIEFPVEFQMGPINTFENIDLIGDNYLFVAGNKLGVNSYHGRYNSQKGIIMGGIDDFQFSTDYGIGPINSQVSNIVVLKMKDKDVIMIFTNDDKVLQYSHTQ